jgi:hypothetical protein
LFAHKKPLLLSWLREADGGGVFGMEAGKQLEREELPGK